jgi:hypothetical protein
MIVGKKINSTTAFAFKFSLTGIPCHPSVSMTEAQLNDKAASRCETASLDL